MYRYIYILQGEETGEEASKNRGIRWNSENSFVSSRVVINVNMKCERVCGAEKMKLVYI